MSANKRIRFVYDRDHVHHNPEGTPLPGPEAEYVSSPIHRLLDPKGDPAGPRHVAPISYAEYCQYQGDPERHVALGAIVDVQCPCCKTWKTGPSLWGIDFMDDSMELIGLRIGDLEYGRRTKDDDCYTVIKAIPGYLQDIARELFDEADREAEKTGQVAEVRS